MRDKPTPWRSGYDGSKDDPRTVALAFYLSILQQSVTGELGMMAASYRLDLPYPNCYQKFSIAEAAVGVLEEEHPGEKFTAKERIAVEKQLHVYIARLFVIKLREARIFQFRERDFESLYHLADVYCTTGAGFKWAPETAGKAPAKEIAKVAEFNRVHGKDMPFPERLPFDSCYFAWGGGLSPSGTLKYIYGLDEKQMHLIMGTLVTKEGWVFTVLLKGRKDAARFTIDRKDAHLEGGQHVIILERIGAYTGPHEYDHEHGDHRPLMNPGWTMPFDFSPWIVAHAVDSIDAADTLTKASPGSLKEKLAFKAVSKRVRQRFLPPPYYVVTVQPTTYEEKEKLIRREAKKLAYRFDVRGHYAHRVYRGTLPIDPKILYQLQKRKYQIFHALNRPTSEAMVFFQRRRLPPLHDGEWIAYLRWRRDNFIKGPKDAPYVPSVRKLKGGIPEVV